MNLLKYTGTQARNFYICDYFSAFTIKLLASMAGFSFLFFVGGQCFISDLRN